MQKRLQGVTALFFIQLFSTLNYSVLYATLVLFSVEALHFSVFRANNMLATFIAFNFVMHFLGGFLGGRFLSFRGLFLIGMILQTLGSLLIALGDMHFVYIAMAIFTAGAGLNVPCINCMLAQLFEQKDKRQESAFLWNYSGMNIGFFIGYSLSGYYQLAHQYSTLFLFSSSANAIAILIVLVFWKRLKDVKTYFSERKSSLVRRTILGVVIIIVCIAGLCAVMSHVRFSAKFVMISGAFIFLGVFILGWRQKTLSDQRKIFAYLFFAVATLIFFTLYQLCPMALTLFLERNVDRHLFGFKVPTAWFLNIDTFIIIFGCPLFSYALSQWRKKGYDISMPQLFSLGLLFVGVAIAILPMGIYFSNHAGFVAIVWPITTYILLALGELVLSPMGYALVGELSPAKLRGVLMGAWLMMSGVAASLSGFFSNKAMGVNAMVSPQLSNSSYSEIFLFLGFISIIFGIILFLMKPFLLKLMNA